MLQHKLTSIYCSKKSRLLRCMAHKYKTQHNTRYKTQHKQTNTIQICKQQDNYVKHNIQSKITTQTCKTQHKQMKTQYRYLKTQQRSESENTTHTSIGCNMGTNLVYSCSNDYECGPRQLLRINIKQIVLRSPLQLGRISNYRLKTVEI